MLLAKSPTAQARREEGKGHGRRLARRGFRPTDLWQEHQATLAIALPVEPRPMPPGSETTFSKAA
jgi:hypothetical protein